MSGRDHPDGLTIQAYVDDELSAEQVRSVDDHLAACPACAAELDELRGVSTWLAGDAADEAPSPVWASVATAAVGPAKPRFGLVFNAGLAAACAAGVVIGLLVGEPPDTSAESTDSVAWSGSTSLFSGTDGSSLLDVYSGLSQTEGTEGS